MYVCVSCALTPQGILRSKTDLLATGKLLRGQGSSGLPADGYRSKSGPPNELFPLPAPNGPQAAECGRPSS